MNFFAEAGELTAGLELLEPSWEDLLSRVASTRNELRACEVGGSLYSGSNGGSAEEPTMDGSSEREISLSSSTSRLPINVP